MKISSTFIAILAPSILGLACLTIPVSAAPSTSPLRGKDKNYKLIKKTSNLVHHRRELEEDTFGTFVIRVVEHDPDRRIGEDEQVEGENEQAEGEDNEREEGEDETLTVQFGDGTFYKIVNAQPGWAKGRISGSEQVRIPKGSLITGAKIDVKGRRPDFSDDHPGNGNPFERALVAQQRTAEQERNLVKLRRNLAVVGSKTVLAVRVIHTGADNLALTAYNGQYAPQATKEIIADDIFGASIGGSDEVNLHSQYMACSHGKLNFQPAGTRTSTNALVTDIVNGICEVEVTTNCNSTNYCNNNYVMQNDVNTALAAAFGTSAENLADYVMHCIPEGAMSYLAYAYVNSWNSVYKNDYCQYTSMQVHEIGHNLGLEHSGELRNEYEDRSGFMGYSYSLDDQRMCFNNAKNYQLGWFPEAYTTLGHQDNYTGPIKGHVNYVDGDNNQDPIVVKVQDPNSERALYIGFNHCVKHHFQSNEACDQVTIQEVASSVLVSPTQSWLVGKLSQGDSWSRALGPARVYVNVTSISNGVDDGEAQVIIRYGCNTDSDCDDGSTCNGLEMCAAGTCQAGQVELGCCGNGICEAGEFPACSDCEKSLTTTFADNNEALGNVFKIDVQDKDILITGFTIHATNPWKGEGRVWAMPGDYNGFENNATAWTIIHFPENQNTNVDANTISSGSGYLAELPLATPLSILAGTTQSFHIHTNIGIRYTNGGGEGNVYTQNPGEVVFYQGKGCGAAFSCYSSPRVWNGIISYMIDTSPTKAPTDLPTASPTSQPTKPPTDSPTSSPTKAPTDSPTDFPTAEPTDSPTTSPTTHPTEPPTDSPTSSPTPGPGCWVHTNKGHCKNAGCSWDKSKNVCA